MRRSTPRSAPDPGRSLDHAAKEPQSTTASRATSHKSGIHREPAGATTAPPQWTATRSGSRASTSPTPVTTRPGAAGSSGPPRRQQARHLRPVARRGRAASRARKLVDTYREADPLGRQRHSPGRAPPKGRHSPRSTLDAGETAPDRHRRFAADRPRRARDVLAQRASGHRHPRPRHPGLRCRTTMLGACPQRHARFLAGQPHHRSSNHRFRRRYHIRLAPGRYVVSRTPQPPIGRGLQPEQARVVLGRVTRVDFSIDTGIR